MSNTTAPRRWLGSAIASAVALAVVIAAIMGTLAAEPVSSAAGALSDILPGGHADDAGGADRATTEGDGVLPEGVSVADVRYAGIANLHPALLQALRDAAADAADDGIEFFISEGWRSPEYQDQLLREAISTYGSAEEARRWVATPETSAHVSGDAVDIGPFDATYWLSANGAAYGLCQVYVNEPWHYELLPEAAADGCPAMYTDPTHDPRMQ
jgi:zinc D-Ala-D-Ala carboxypeptidase